MKIVNDYPPDIYQRQYQEMKGLLFEYQDDLKKALKEGGNYKDLWGSIWNVREPGVIGEVIKPIISDLLDFKRFKPPTWPKDIVDKEMSRINEMCKNTEQFVLSDVTARLFESLQFIRGSQNLFLDITYDEPIFYKLLNMVYEYHMEEVEYWCKTEVDAVHLLLKDAYLHNNSITLFLNKTFEKKFAIVKIIGLFYKNYFLLH